MFNLCMPCVKPAIEDTTVHAFQSNETNFVSQDQPVKYETPTYQYYPYNVQTTQPIQCFQPIEFIPVQTIPIYQFPYQQYSQTQEPLQTPIGKQNSSTSNILETSNQMQNTVDINKLQLLLERTMYETVSEVYKNTDPQMFLYIFPQVLNEVLTQVLPSTVKQSYNVEHIM